MSSQQFFTVRGIEPPGLPLFFFFFNVIALSTTRQKATTLSKSVHYSHLIVDKILLLLYFTIILALHFNKCLYNAFTVKGAFRNKTEYI